VPYEQRYCDAKSESGNFLLRNVVVIVIINVIVNYIYICHLFMSTATSDARGAGDRLCLHERGKERKREGDSERARERAKERGRERKSKTDSERARKKANSVYVPSVEYRSLRAVARTP